MDTNTLLNEAFELINEKQYEKASVVLSKAEIQEPENPEVLKNLGLCYVNLEDYKRAQTIFEKVIKLDKTDANSWFYFASTSEKTDDFNNAIKGYKKVIALRNEFLDAYKSLGVLYLKLGRYEDLLDDVSPVLDFSEDDYQLFYIISSAHLALQNDDKAMEYILKAHELNPTHSQILNNLASLYLTMGDSKTAESYLQKALEQDENDALTNFNLASLYQLKGDYAKALELFDRSYAKEPSTVALSSLAYCAIQSGKWKMATDLYKNLMALCPEKENFKMNYVNCCIETGNYKEGLDIAQKLAKINQKSIDIQKKLAYLYRLNKQPQNAIEVLEGLIRRGKIDFDTYYNLAMSQVNIGDLESARENFKKCIQLEPENPIARKDLGILYLHMNFADWAKEELAEAARLSNNDPEYVFNYAICLNEINEFKEAKEQFLKAIELDETNSDYYAYYGETLVNLGEIEEAKEILKQSIVLNPRNAKASFYLAKIYFNEKKYKIAKDLLEVIVDTPNNTEIVHLLANAYYKLKNYENAQIAYGRLIEHFPESHILLTSYAKCCLKLKQLDKAKRFAKMALELYPECEDAIKILKEVTINE